MWDDLLEIMLEFVSALVGDVTEDTSIPREIRCTIQAICGIVLAAIVFLLGYLFEMPIAMTISSIIAGIVLLITAILVFRNWRRG